MRPAAEALLDRGGDGRGRFAVAALVFATAFMVLAGRAMQLASGPEDGGFAIAARGATAAVARRGDIVDRHGEMLATSLQAYSLYADPREVWNPDATAEALAGVLSDLDVQTVRDKLAGSGRFVWIERGLSPRLRQAVFDLALPGLKFRAEPSRIYPRGRLASHVLGYTSVDGLGLAGAERAFDGELARGESVRLSLDLRVQFALEEELRAAVEAYGAQGAVGLVTQVRTGEILAMASLPDFNPHDPVEGQPQARFNRAVSGVYEMGSVFKVFTYAMALDRGVIGPNELLPTTRTVRAGSVLVGDHTGVPRDLTAREAFVRSSNVGAAYLGVNTPPNVFSRYLENFGLLTAAPLEFSSTARPLTPADWEEPARATIAYGHGLAVSPVAFAAAFGAAVNGGIYAAPRLTPAEAGSLAPRRVIGPEASAQLRDFLREAVASGTGRRADAVGFAVGGKTGTAEQPARGGYDPDHVIASFAAMFPSNAPRHAVLIMLDRPRPSGSAALTAAPVAGRVVSRIAPILGVPTQRSNAGLAAMSAVTPPAGSPP